jgi:hypothetical protein
MAMSNRFTRAIILAAGFATTAFGYAPRAQASVIVTMEEVGSDVVLMGSGSLNLAGLSFFATETIDSIVFPSVGVFGVGPNIALVDIYSGVTGPSNFGSGTYTVSDSGSGDTFSIDSAGQFLLDVPTGYTGGALSGSSTYANSTFASLGVTPGTYVWTWGNSDLHDSLTLEIETTPTGVPEPATTLLLGLPIAATMLARRRAKRLGTST